MKPYKKFLSFKYYLAYLRRQPVHMQHVYSVTFSAIITGIIAALILYYDYGFWRERYDRTDLVETVASKQEEAVVKSPGEMLQGFVEEAGAKMKEINTSNSNILEGKDEYVKDDETVTNTVENTQ